MIERSRLSIEQRQRLEERMIAQDEARLAQLNKRQAEREALYLDYLKALDEYVILVTSGTIDPRKYGDWWQSFQTLDNQMDLFATDDVRGANTAVYAEMDAVSAALDSTDTFMSDVRRLFASHRPAFERARAGLVERMRQEVRESIDA